MNSHLLPSEDEMVRAVFERDESYAGVFFLGVRTTGVFCRPGCPARRPRRDSLAFFATAEEAEAAGFRACRRCRPLEAPGAHPAWVQDLIARVDASGERLTDARLRALGVEPARARRYFQRRFGATFQAWQRERRLGGAWTELRAGAGVDDAGLGAGWESTSGFRDAFARVFGAPPGRGRSADRLVTDLLPTPLGAMVAVATEDRLALLEFADRRALPEQGRALRRWFPGTVVPGRNAVLDRLERELDEWFAGRRAEFTVPVDLRGTDFQLAVWRALLAIPHGATLSYGELARELGRPGASRAVGRANGQNRLAILVPCHRVVESGGALRGYGGGLWRKRRLLELERDAPAELG